LGGYYIVDEKRVEKDEEEGEEEEERELGSMSGKQFNTRYP